MMAATRRRDPERVKTGILDAAEALFADHGYYGVTMREIAARCGTHLGTVTHHFATKEDVFRHAILRRADEYINRTDASLRSVLDGQKDPVAIDLILSAFVSPIMKLSADGGPGWKNYVRLLAGSMNNRQNEPFLASILDKFDPMTQRVMDAVIGGHSNVPIERLHWAFFFVEAALIHILLEAGVVERHAGSMCASTDLTRIREEMIPFFSSGFEKLRVHYQDVAQSGDTDN